MCRNTDGLIDDDNVVIEEHDRQLHNRLRRGRLGFGLGIDRKNPTRDQAIGPRNLSTADSNEAVGNEVGGFVSRYAGEP